MSRKCLQIMGVIGKGIFTQFDYPLSNVVDFDLQERHVFP